MVSALLIARSFFLNRHARLRVKVKLLICVDQVVNYPERFLLTNCRHLKVSVLHNKQNVVVPPLEKNGVHVRLKNSLRRLSMMGEAQKWIFNDLM